MENPVNKEELKLFIDTIPDNLLEEAFGILQDFVFRKTYKEPIPKPRIIEAIIVESDDNTPVI